MYHHGLFAFSGDPITLGHVALIERIAKQCEKLTVVIAVSDTKTPTFTMDERRYFAEEALRVARIKNVSVIASPDVLGAIFLDHNCDVLFRGIRGDKDRMEERELIGTYEAVWPFLKDRIFVIEASDAYRHISSSMAKVCARHCLPLEAFVPLHVKRALEERVAKQWKFGVTGRMASGKTWLSKKLCEACMSRGVPAHRVAIDEVILAAYNAQTEGGEALRNSIAEMLGADALTDDAVNTRFVGNVLFHADTSDEVRRAFLELTSPYVQREYQKILHKKEGLILVEWSQFAEMGMLPWVNNNIIHVYTDENTNARFASQRGVNADTLAARQRHQWSYETTREAIESAIKESRTGVLLRYHNFFEVASLEGLAEHLITLLPGLQKLRT